MKKYLRCGPVEIIDFLARDVALLTNIIRIISGVNSYYNLLDLFTENENNL